MKITVKLTSGGKVRMPETFVATIGKGNPVDIYFGKNFDIVAVVAANKKLEGMDRERVEYLTSTTISKS